jgi:3-hydroxyacyl-CoA dehydrogenase
MQTSQYNNFGYWINVALNNICVVMPHKSPDFIQKVFDVPVARKNRSDAFTEIQIHQLIDDIHQMLTKGVLEKEAYDTLMKSKRLPVARRGNIMGAPTFHRYYYEHRKRLGLKRPTKTEQILKMIKDGKKDNEIIKTVKCGESTLRQIHIDLRRQEFQKY